MGCSRPSSRHRDLSQHSLVAVEPDVFVQVSDALVATLGNVDCRGLPVAGGGLPQSLQDRRTPAPDRDEVNAAGVQLRQFRACGFASFESKYSHCGFWPVRSFQ